jgi:hypothetical protein
MEESNNVLCVLILVGIVMIILCLKPPEGTFGRERLAASSHGHDDLKSLGAVRDMMVNPRDVANATVYSNGYPPMGPHGCTAGHMEHIERLSVGRTEQPLHSHLYRTRDYPYEMQSTLGDGFVFSAAPGCASGLSHPEPWDRWNPPRCGGKWVTSMRGL